jgi:iron complex transport system ATP-binding protein
VNATAPPVLRCEGLEVAVPGRTLVKGLELSARRGDFLGVLGENGVGKTLTLHTLAGLRPPAAGQVHWLSRNVDNWPRRELARTLGLLAQNSEDPFPTTVLETAVMGRHPHIDFWRWEAPEDYEIARRALAAVDLAGLEGREVQTLSGGERRRLAIATVLAQDPAVYVLDEPTNHLDPHHQVDALGLFHARARDGALVIASLHDATLAARYADHVLMLFGDGRWLYGTSREILTAEHLSELYRTPIEELSHRGRRVFVGA